MTPQDNLQADIDAVNRIPIIDTILQVVCITTGMGFAAVTRVTNERWIACAVRDEIDFGLKTGGELELETTLCHEVHLNNKPIIIDNVSQNKVYANHHTPAMYGLQSYISVPITLQNGSFFGTLCAIDPKPAQLDNPVISGMFSMYSELISFHLNALEQVEEATANLNESQKDVTSLRDFSEELQATNEKLNQSRSELLELNEIIKASEARTHIFIDQAPVAIIVFKTDDLIIEAANPPMLTLLGKDASIIDQPLLKAIPELKGQEPYNLLHQVLKTGEAVHGYDTPVTFIKNGRQETNYYNFTYSPLIENGAITGVIDMAVNVTEQVKASQSVQLLNAELIDANKQLSATNTELSQSQQELIAANKHLETVTNNLKQAINVAQIDLWTVDLITGAITFTSRSKSLHGLPDDHELTYEQSLNLLAPEHSKSVNEIIQNAIKNLSSFTVEYMIRPGDGKKPRWMRSTGQVYANEAGLPVKMAGLMIDITEQKEDEQRKNDFIGMVSHELKTPLTSLKGYVQILNNKAANAHDKAVTTMLDKANNQIKKMTTMINGFLNVSRLESGKIHIDKQRFDLKELVKEMEEEVEATIFSHKIIFAPVEITYVVADRDKIGQVINNLISNAVKYSPLDSTINIACITTMDNHAQFSVKDQGMGIKPEDVDKLFDRYYRVESTNNVSGFGIGLYLSAEIIKRHNGKIWVESKAGNGSIFYFVLPLG